MINPAEAATFSLQPILSSPFFLNTSASAKTITYQGVEAPCETRLMDQIIVFPQLRNILPAISVLQTESSAASSWMHRAASSGCTGLVLALHFE